MRVSEWNLARLFMAEESGAGESASSGGGGGSSPASATSAASSSPYSVTDPGYTVDATEADEPADELAQLKAENAPKDKTSADEAPTEPAEASADAGGDAEETAESNEDFSDELLSRAVALGYTVADIKSFRSEKSLEKEVSRVERIQQRMASQQAARADQAPPATDTVPPDQAEPNWAQMIEDGHDENFVAMQRQTWQRAQAAEAGLRQLQQAQQQRDYDAQVERFDSTLNDLGEEYESLFGKGSIRDVNRVSPDLAKKRVEVFHKFQQLKNSYLMNRLPLPPERELIEEAVHARFWKQTKTLARKELTNDIKKAGSQALSRPRSSGRQALTGASAALAKEQDFWKKFS